MGRRAPTTLPSLAEMAAYDESRRQREAAEAFDLYSSMPEIESVSPDFFSGARGFESRAGLPADLDEYLNLMDLQEMPGLESARGMGLGSPRFMPMTGNMGRLSDLQTAVNMARDRVSAGDLQGSMDLLDIYNRRARGRGFAMGGEIEGPGTGTSDSIPAEIYQNGRPVQKAALSDGEFVMTADAVKGAGNGSRERGVSRMYELMRRFESGETA